MKIIKDPVHGYVEVDPGMMVLLDAAPVQRLRYIKQLGFSHLVYPGANHTRFEHSLGTMHLSRLLSRQLGLSSENEKMIAAAALLHDIGHSPYSHATEPLMEEYLGRKHHQIQHLVQKGEVATILEKEDIDPEMISAIVQGEHPLGGIIQGDLDVDRMDYLLRDAHYTGVPYGTVDAHRLIHHTLLSDFGIALDEAGIHAAESLLIARTLMRPAVYFHHVSRIAESMVQSAAVAHLGEVGIAALGPLLMLDDAAFFRELQTSPSRESRVMMDLLYRRKLYKRALYVGKEYVNPVAMQAHVSIEEGQKKSTEIAEIAGIAPSAVLVDIPPFPVDMSMEVYVKNRHDLVELEQISPLMRTLNETRKEQWRVGVYTLPEYRTVVQDAAVESLHVKRPTKQDKLAI
jgi:HD superfamily phosphohydrolase